MYFVHNYSPNHPRFIPISPPSQICIIFFSFFSTINSNLCCWNIVGYVASLENSWLTRSSTVKETDSPCPSSYQLATTPQLVVEFCDYLPSSGWALFYLKLTWGLCMLSQSLSSYVQLHSCGPEGTVSLYPSTVSGSYSLSIFSYAVIHELWEKKRWYSI